MEGRIHLEDEICSEDEINSNERVSWGYQKEGMHMIIKVAREETTRTAYKAIKEKSDSNIFIQAFSGIFGFPATILVDGAVIFTHYGPMINEIREIFGRKPLKGEVLIPVIKSISEEILFDLVADKVMGQIPLVGIYANAICARAMTWRLGMLFSALSSQGEEINTENLEETIKLIRVITPQKTAFKFTQPSYEEFEKLVL